MAHTVVDRHAQRLRDRVSFIHRLLRCLCQRLPTRGAGLTQDKRDAIYTVRAGTGSGINNGADVFQISHRHDDAVSRVIADDFWQSIISVVVLRLQSIITGLDLNA